jgi:hypothetical protein
MTETGLGLNSRVIIGRADVIGFEWVIHSIMMGSASARNEDPIGSACRLTPIKRFFRIVTGAFGTLALIQKGAHVMLPFGKRIDDEYPEISKSPTRYDSELIDQLAKPFP